VAAFQLSWAAQKANEFLVLARRWLEEPGSCPVSPPGGFYERLLRASLQTGHAAAAFVEQQALGRAILGEEEPPAEEAPVPAKDRVRAMRERRRSGLVHCAQVDLTPGDIDLLQAYGLLLPKIGRTAARLTLRWAISSSWRF
jgi:hypothetical protein